MRTGSENYFIFGDVNTADFGVYCSGGGTYNAPQRDVNAYHILGRNGDLMIDHGSYKNVDVTYPCWIARGAPDKVDAFRQALCSLRGYQQIEDPYHPDEYRMGIYVDSFAPDMLNAHNDSMKMDVVFNCKPQRFLKSGSTAQQITSGSTLTNPTLYASRPQLQAWGYGTISINGEEITIENVELGDVTLEKNLSGPDGLSVQPDTYFFNTGDVLTVSGAYAQTRLNALPAAYSRIESITLTETTATGLALTSENLNNYAILKAAFPAEEFTAGTAKTISATYTAQIVIYQSTSGQRVTATATISVNLEYTGRYFMFGTTCTIASASATFLQHAYNAVRIRAINAYSSKPWNGTPTYIDLESGEAWMSQNGMIMEISGPVNIPEELPELQAGDNTISFSDTITLLDIIPRWWTI